MDAIEKVIEKLKVILTGNVSLYEPRIEKKLYEELGIAEEVAKMWVDGISNMDAISAINHGRVSLKFSIKEDFATQIDKVLNNNGDFEQTHLYMGETPKILTDLGLRKLPMLITAKHIYTMAKDSGKYKKVNYHNLGGELIKQLPKAIAEPIGIMESATKDDSVVVLTELIDKESRPVIVAIKFDGLGFYNDIKIQSNIVTSGYGKNNAKAFINRMFNEKRVLYWDNKKAGTIKILGIQFPNKVDNSDFTDTVSRFKEKVNETSNEENKKFSLKDNKGNELTKGQQEYFKNSKVRDGEGNLMVMYHGTPNGNFTVFKDGTYFTANEQYAERYQDPSSISISYGKEKVNPKTYAVYLNITKPFDIRNDSEARRIYIEDYIKGGNALGINPYKSDAFYDDIKEIDWAEGEDLRDFLIEEEYDYDGLVLDEGADGGYGAEVAYRGDSYVAFSPEQIKSIDNKNPTDDKDIRFSIKDNGNNLTAKQYFRFGWATANGVLNTKEAVDFFDKLKYAESKKYPKSKDGYYIIEVGEKDGINNKLVYTNGDWNDPSIYKVVTINAIEDETILTEIRKDVYYYEKKQGGISQQAYEDIQRKGILSETFRTDWDSYEEFKARRERRSGEGDSRGDRGLDGRGRSVESDKKYSLKTLKQDKTLKKLRKQFTEGEARLKENLSSEERSDLLNKNMELLMHIQRLEAKEQLANIEGLLKEEIDSYQKDLEGLEDAMSEMGVKPIESNVVDVPIITDELIEE